MLGQLGPAAEPRALGHGAGATFICSLDFEMDAIADELRKNPLHICDDDQIAFRQLQKLRMPDLSKEQWLELFEVRREQLHCSARSPDA